jgi:hypothetical protein
VYVSSYWTHTQNKNNYSPNGTYQTLLQDAIIDGKQHTASVRALFAYLSMQQYQSKNNKYLCTYLTLSLCIELVSLKWRHVRQWYIYLSLSSRYGIPQNVIFGRFFVYCTCLLSCPLQELKTKGLGYSHWFPGETLQAQLYIVFTVHLIIIGRVYFCTNLCTQSYSIIISLFSPIRISVYLKRHLQGGHKVYKQCNDIYKDCIVYACKLCEDGVLNTPKYV